MKAKYRVAFNKLVCLVNDSIKYLDEPLSRQFRRRLTEIKAEAYPTLSNELATEHQSGVESFAHSFFKSQFYEHAPIGFLILNTGAGILDFNQKASEYWGLAQGSFRGLSIYTLLDARFGVKMNHLLREVLQTREERSFEGFCRRLDGTSFFARFHLAIAHGGGSANDIFLVSVVDISEELNNHRIIRSIARSASTTNESEFIMHLLRLLAAIDRVSLVMIALQSLDEEHISLYWNKDAKTSTMNFSDYPMPTLIAVEDSLLGTGLSHEYIKFVMTHFADGKICFPQKTLNSFIRSPSGQRIGHISLFFASEPRELELYQDIIDIFAFRITQERGRYEFLRKERSIKESLEVMVNERTKDLDEKAKRLQLEIDQRRLAEGKLLEEKQKAEAANLAKSQFLANMSHEIRTPLNGILGIVSILSDANSKKKRDEYLQVINRSGTVLTRIIDDILDLSRLEAGQIQIHSKCFNLRETILEVYHSHLPLALKKKLALRVFYPFNIPESFVGDSTRLRQVLDNLVSNAIKYTDKGWVFLKVSVRANVCGQALLKISVRDSGVGISKDQSQIIWGRFERLDHSTTRKADGFGLGLAITRKLLSLMGARIQLESKLGSGSDFTSYCRLPLGPSSPRKRARQRQRVLLLGSCTVRRSELARLLKSAAFAVTESMLSPQRALSNEHDLVMVDLCRMEEITALKQLERIARTQRRFSVYATALQRELLLDLPSSCNIIDYESFISDITKVLDPPAWIPDTLLPTKFARSGARVLLAEDNLVNQKVSFEMLKILGIEADIVENGRQAVVRVSQEDYDVVLMDCFMPEMDGVEAMRRIRSSNAGSTPIVAVTAIAIQGARERYLSEGFDAYLAKPFKIDDLRAVLEPYLGFDREELAVALECESIDKSLDIWPELS